MLLIPWRCYEDLSCFAQEMNRLFDRFFGREMIDRPGGKISYPPLRISETETEIQVYLEVPEAFLEEIEIIFKENLLVIKNEKPEESKAKEICSLEKRTGSFRHTIRIDKKVRADAIKAKYRDGILIIILPKVKPKSTAFKVQIE